MSVSLLEFAAARLGKTVQSPGGLGGECVDLVELWLMARGRPRVAGNAVDLLRNAPPVYKRVENSADNFPSAGDVVVWGQSKAAGTGVYGHCAVCVHADSMWLLTLDQNWPEHAPVSLVLHTYAGVLGWLQSP